MKIQTNTFSIESGEIIPTHGSSFDFLPSYEAGKYPTLVEVQPGTFTLATPRRVQYLKPSPEGWGGWIHVKGEQVKARGVSLSYKGQIHVFAVVDYEYRTFQAPFPLMEKSHASRYSSSGLDGRMTAAQWARALKWKGVGSIQAAEALRYRWSILAIGGPVQECPSVRFPPVEREAVPPVEDAPDWREAMEAMQREIADLRQRVEVLEFIP